MMPVEKHVELEIIDGQRLGCRPRDPDRRVMLFSDYRTGVVPAHPLTVDYYSRVATWLLGGNNQFSTCGPTSLANSLLLTSTWLTNTPIRATDEDIFDLYRRSGNPDFDPATGAGDNGVDMTVMLSEAVRNGIVVRGVRYRPAAFALIDGTDVEEIRTASAIFGSTLGAAGLTQAQQRQATWDYVPGDTPWGGHAFLLAGRYSDNPSAALTRTGAVTWARDLDATDAFLAQQTRERYVVIWPWHLSTKGFLEGVDGPALAADYQLFTHRPFPSFPPMPVSPPPAPVPVAPVPVPPLPIAPDVLAANLALARAVPESWLKGFHIGVNEHVRSALEEWFRVTGYTPVK